MVKTLNISNLDYSTTLGCKYIGIRKSEFVAKTQFLDATYDIASVTLTQDNIFIFNFKTFCRKYTVLRLE